MLPPEVYEYESRIRTARSLDDAPFIEAQEDYERKLDAFDQSIEDFLDLVERAIEKQNGRKPNRGIVRETASDKSWMKGPMGRVMRNKFSHSWVPLANAGVKLMDLGMDRKIPKSKARKFTAFSRLWGSARSVPRNILTWQERHHRTLDFGREMILNSEGDWTLSTSSESETSGGQTFRVGKFTVHNINSLEGKRLDEFKTIINKAAKVIPSAKIPGFAKALYGDIYLVGSIRGSRTQAWYDSSKDLVYLRTDKRVQSDPLHSLIHELAHRYWRKFADADAKKVWGQRHFDMSRGQPDMTGHWPVKAGMRLPFAVKWQMAKRKYVKSNPGEPVVTRVRGAMVELDIPKVGLREVGLDWYRKGLRQHLHQSSFPSAYASTDPEEHFCEAAGYRALNQLSKDHKEALDRIFGR
jgi:hypothetical protein